MSRSVAGMPQPEGIVNGTGQLGTNPTSRNSRNERSNKGHTRAAAEQRRIEQQRWGQCITDGEEDSAHVAPASAPRSSNRRRGRRNRRNNSTHHVEENDYYEYELALHAARPRNEICDDLELEMALSLSLSLADSTSNSRNHDYNNQSIDNMSYEALVQLESVKCVAPVNVVSSMLDITFNGSKSEQGFPKEEEKCAICQCEYEQHDHIMSLPCTHGFHYSCGSEWLLNYSKLCPICKIDVTEENFVDM